MSGLFFKDPPKNWWRAQVDSLNRAGDAETSAALAKNPPASRQYTPGEALRTGIVPPMWFCTLGCAGVSVFGISFQVPFAKEMGFGPLDAASSMGVMSEPLFLVFAFPSGVGGGTFYPCSSHSSPIPSTRTTTPPTTAWSTAPSSSAASSAAAWAPLSSARGAYVGAYTTAGVVCLVATGLALLLRQPGGPTKGGLFRRTADATT